MDHSIGLFVTEAWLHQDIFDAEVQINDYCLFRSDRMGRSRGGVAAYLRTDLGCITAYESCNSYVETLLIKCKKLETLFGVIYHLQILLKMNGQKHLMDLEVTRT